VGVVRERWRTADSKGEYLTPDYRVIKAGAHSTQPGIGRPTVHPCYCTSVSACKPLGFKELAAALTPVRTGVQARISFNTLAIMLATRLRTTNDGGMSFLAFHAVPNDRP